MSVALQANNKLTQLVTLTAKIESYLNPAKKGKGDGQAQIEGGGSADNTKDAIAVGGMASSLSTLIKQTEKLNPKSGEQLKKFVISLSEGIKDAAKNIEGIDTNDLSSKLTNFYTSFSQNILKFVGTMVLVGVAAPLYALGILVFSMGVVKMLEILSNAVAVSPKILIGIAIINYLAKNVAKFVLTMTLVGLVAPLFALGVITFALSIAAMLKIFSNVAAANVKTMLGLAIISYMLSKIKSFSLAMVLIGLTAPIYALGVLVFILSITAITKALMFVGNPKVTEGANVIRSISLTAVLFSLSMLLIGAFADKVALGAITVSLSITAVGGALYLLGMLNSKRDVTKGAITLKGLVLPLMGFSAALLILSLIPGSPAELALKMAAVGASIVVLGLAAFVLGIPAVAPFVTTGAGVLALLGGSLLIFAGALFILSKVNFSKEQADNLGYTFVEIGKSLAILGFMAPLAIVGAAALIPMSVALIPLSGALAMFKTIDWKESDGALLKNALQSTVQAYSSALDGVGITGMLKLVAAIPIIGMLGFSLSSIAQGIKEMANLTFTQLEWDESQKKLVPKKQVKLTDSEIRSVGPNVASILNALVEPLTTFGMNAAKGEGLFSDGYLEKGIDASAKVGNIISTLAKGVADMANLKVISYKVSKGELVPSGIRPINSDDFINAGFNVAQVLKALVEPLTTFGKNAANGEGLFRDGYLEKGIDASAKVGNVISTLAKGVVDMANLNIVTYKISKDKLVPAEIRPITPDDFNKAGANVNSILMALVQPLTDFGKAWTSGSGWFSKSNIEHAVKGISEIIDPITKVAKLITDLASGTAVINEIRNGKLVPVGTVSFAQAIPKATAAIDTLLKTIPTVFTNFGYFYISQKDIFNESINGLKHISEGISEIADIGKKINERKSDLEGSSDVAKLMGPVTANMISVLKSYSEMQSFVFANTGIFKKEFTLTPVFTDIGNSLSAIQPGLQKIDPVNIMTFGNLTSVIERLTKIVTPFEKFVKAFGTFSKDIGVFAKNWKNFTEKDAASFKIYGDVTEKISKVDVGKLKEALDALIVYEKQKLEIELEKAKLIKESGLESSPSGVFDKLNSLLDSFVGGGTTTESLSTEGGIISTPKIQVNGNIFVSGNIDKT